MGQLAPLPEHSRSIAVQVNKLKNKNGSYVLITLQEPFLFFICFYTADRLYILFLKYDSLTDIQFSVTKINLT